MKRFHIFEAASQESPADLFMFVFFNRDHEVSVDEAIIG